MHPPSPNMDSICRILYENKVFFASNADVWGSSGVSHNFDIVIAYEGNRFGLDFTYGSAVDVFAEYIKWQDTPLCGIILALLHAPEDPAKFLLSAYKIPYFVYWTDFGQELMWIIRDTACLRDSKNTTPYHSNYMIEK